MIDFAINKLRDALENSEQLAKDYAGDALLSLVSFQVGFLKVSIEEALKALEDAQCLTT